MSIGTTAIELRVFKKKKKKKREKHFWVSQGTVVPCIQVNEKFFELKKGHIGIVEKAQETRSDSDMHI